MLTYAASQRGALKMPDYVDPNDITTVQILWGPPQYQMNQIYLEGQYMTSSVPNGYYYECITNGITDPAVMPTFANVNIQSGMAVFQPVPWDWWLNPGESLVSSEWIDTNAIGLTFLTTNTDTIATDVQIGTLPTGTTQFTVTNIVTRANGDQLNRSLTFKVSKQ